MRPGGAAIAALLLALLPGCCLPDGLVALNPGEKAGVEALLVTLGDYAAAQEDERPRRIHRELVACLEDGRMLRGDCEGEFVLGRTCDDVVCLDVDVPFDLDHLRRDAATCMLAIAILYHEGVHLDQDLGDFLFGDHEEDAYRTTHRMQGWLAEEIADRVAPLAEVSYGPAEVLEGLEAARVGMGEEYLAEICPAHARRNRLVAFLADHRDEDLAWLEIPPLVPALRARADGRWEATIDLGRGPDGVGGRTKAVWFGGSGRREAPSWPSAAAMLRGPIEPEFVLGWYRLRRGEANPIDDWNRRLVGPEAWRLEDERLVLVLPRLDGEGEPALAFSLTVLIHFPAPD
ncbi:MAG: hypothetical protein H6807_09460 [Planctomycetes bacterium]|nr:hypothetical protein [Planctomycetota bacterium]